MTSLFKITLLAILIATLTSCEPSSTQVHPEVLAAGLADCTFYVQKSSGGSHLTIVRCPSSTTTTTKAGKHPDTVAVAESDIPMAEQITMSCTKTPNGLLCTPTK